MEGKYAFSLSETALLESKLGNGQELNQEQIDEFKQLSSDDKLYNQILVYLSMRLRTRWELELYLKRKKASPALTDSILNKLSNNNMINDEKFARAWVNDRQLLRPTSRRKLILELKQKHVKDEIIQTIMADQDQDSEQANLAEIVKNKRKQTKYQDDLKLMQYLARHGFGYGDIKRALQKS